jgi:hypothetical protein
MSNPRPARLLSRAIANAVAVAAVTAIFGLKAGIDAKVRDAEQDRLAARAAAIGSYEPYFTEHP